MINPCDAVYRAIVFLWPAHSLCHVYMYVGLFIDSVPIYVHCMRICGLYMQVVYVVYICRLYICRLYICRLYICRLYALVHVVFM